MFAVLRDGSLDKPWQAAVTAHLVVPDVEFGLDKILPYFTAVGLSNGHSFRRVTKVVHKHYIVGGKSTLATLRGDNILDKACYNRMRIRYGLCWGFNVGSLI